MTKATVSKLLGTDSSKAVMDALSEGKLTPSEYLYYFTNYGIYLEETVLNKLIVEEPKLLYYLDTCSLNKVKNMEDYFEEYFEAFIEDFGKVGMLLSVQSFSSLKAYYKLMNKVWLNTDSKLVNYPKINGQYLSGKEVCKHLERYDLLNIVANYLDKDVIRKVDLKEYSNYAGQYIELRKDSSNFTLEDAIWLYDAMSDQVDDREVVFSCDSYYANMLCGHLPMTIEGDY